MDSPSPLPFPSIANSSIPCFPSIPFSFWALGLPYKLPVLDLPLPSPHTPADVPSLADIACSLSSLFVPNFVLSTLSSISALPIVSALLACLCVAGLGLTPHP